MDRGRIWNPPLQVSCVSNTPTNPNLKFQPFKQKLTSTTLSISQTQGRGDRVSAAPIACEGGGDLISPRAAYATLRLVSPLPQKLWKESRGNFLQKFPLAHPPHPPHPPHPRVPASFAENFTKFPLKGVTISRKMASIKARNIPKEENHGRPTHHRTVFCP